MTALLYAVTAVSLLWFCDRYVVPVSRGAALALLLIPLCFTVRPLLTGRVYGPVDIAYQSQPLRDYRAQMGIGEPQNRLLSDITFQMIPWRESLRRSLAAREWPLLNRFILCGDFLAASGQPAVFNPFTLVGCLLPTGLSFTFTGAITFFIAGLSAFIFARLLACSLIASLVAAIGWTYSAVIALTVLWPWGFAWTLLPFIFAGTRLVVTAPGARSIGVLTVGVGLEILAGHPETALHVILLTALYSVFELIGVHQRRAREVLSGILAVTLAVLLTAVFILPFLDAVRHTREYWIRTAIYARGPLRVPPRWVSTAIRGDLFPFVRIQSDQLSLARAEVGSIVLALGICGICRVRCRYTWFFVALLIFGFFAGAQAWPVAQLLHSLPLLNVALNDRLVAVVPFSLSILAALTIDHIPRRQIVTTMLALLAIIAAASFYFQINGPIDSFRLLADTVPLAAAAVLILIERNGLALPLLIGVLLAQRVLADGSLVPVYEERLAYPSIPIFEPLKRVVEPFRVVGKGPLLLTNTATMYGLEDPRGTTAMTLREFADTYPLWITSGYRQFDQVNDLTRPILSMLNIRFAFTNVWDAIPEGWREVMVDRGTRLIENERVLPRAFVPRRVRFGLSSQEELSEMARQNDFSELAWIDVPERRHDRMNGPGEVLATRSKLGLRLYVTMQNGGFVIITQAALPGWRTYVDGRRVKTLRGNHAFLAVYVPQGEHRIRLHYLPQSFVAGRAISFGTILLLVGLWVLGRCRVHTKATP